MFVLVNYATGKYKRTQKLNSWTGKYIAGFDRIVECNDSDIDEKFKKDNSEIFDQKNALFIWKPYIILKFLLDLDDGDVLFYCDSGAFFIRRIKEYFQNMESDIWVSDIPFLEKQFSRKDAFRIIGCNHSSYGQLNQIQAGFIGVRKNEDTVKFIKNWLEYCKIIDVVGNSYGKEDDSFVENRDDQTALSLLCKREGIVPYPDPTQYGKVPEEYMRDDRFIFRIPTQNYKREMFIVLHRTPDVNFKVCIKQIMVAILPRSISVKLIKAKREKKII